MNNQGVNSFSISQLRDKLKLTEVACINNDIIILDESLNDLELFKYPCRIDVLLAALCTEGRMKIKINLKEYEISESMLAVYTPSNIIQIDYTNNFKAKVVAVSSSFVKNIHIDIKNIIPFYMQIQNQSCQKIEKEDTFIFNKFFNLIKYVIQSPNTIHKTEVIQGIISATCFAIMDSLGGNALQNTITISQNNRQKIIFEQFMTLLNDHHQTERSVGFYADKLCVTPKYLSKLIKESSGKTAAEWIDEYVILEAKTLLKYSDMTIQEIAYNLNFSTQSFFCKYFKHQTGITPGEYKEC